MISCTIEANVRTFKANWVSKWFFKLKQTKVVKSAYENDWVEGHTHQILKPKKGADYLEIISVWFRNFRLFYNLKVKHQTASWKLVKNMPDR